MKRKNNTYIILILIILSILSAIVYTIQKPKKKTLKLKLGTTFYLPIHSKERHHMQSLEQFIEYFLPIQYNYEIVDTTQKSDITVWDIYLADNAELREDEINILICVENIDHWKLDGYKHFSKYGNYGDPKMHIYLYNHIDRIHKTQQSLATPLIHNYIQYYQRNAHHTHPSKYISFHEKKFCLYTKRHKDAETDDILNTLNAIAPVDHISQYTNILDKSCYHSVEFLNILQQYKFIMCFENSYKDGYITEKIFNCFFARTIPIYKGSEKADSYFSSGSYINVRKIHWIEDVKRVMNDEKLYNSYIHRQKISNAYDNENYQKELVHFIEQRV